jgi:glycosyltransferase involved in cell wall biosynthesis
MVKFQHADIMNQRIMPFFSVITPAYNRAALIGTAIESVLAQDFTDWEMIIVDDGSRDTTVHIVSQYVSRDSRIKLFQQQNQGPGAARNLAITHVTGQYTAFLDSDDLWFPWTLATYRKAIDEYKQPAFIAGLQVNFQSEAELTEVKPEPFKARLFPDYFTAATTAAAVPLWILPGAVAIRSDALRAAGGFTNERINAEDSDLWLKLGLDSNFVRVYSPPAVGYRRHGDSAVATLEKTYLGTVRIIDQETSGRYPGGDTRRLERLTIIGELLRPVAIACLKQGSLAHALTLYRRTFAWHLRLRRFKYLIAFPLIAIASLLRRRPTTQQPTTSAASSESAW